MSDYKPEWQVFIIPKIKGGREEEENLQMLCKLCHRTKLVESYY